MHVCRAILHWNAYFLAKKKWKRQFSDQVEEKRVQRKSHWPKWRVTLTVQRKLFNFFWSRDDDDVTRMLCVENVRWRVSLRHKCDTMWQNALICFRLPFCFAAVQTCCHYYSLLPSVILFCWTQFIEKPDDL